MILENDFILVINSEVNEINQDGSKTKLFDYKKSDWTLSHFDGKKINALQIKGNGFRKILYLYVGENVESIAEKEMLELVENFKENIVNFVW